MGMGTPEEEGMSAQSSVTGFLQMKPVGRIGPGMQVAVLALLYACTVLLGYAEYAARGTLWGYPLSVSLLFAPLYEEVIFRGILLPWLLHRLPPGRATAVVSVLFGLWHLKNVFWLGPERVLAQMAYTGLVVSPLLCWVTLRTRSAWPAAILHYAHNILASPLVFGR